MRNVDFVALDVPGAFVKHVTFFQKIAFQKRIHRMNTHYEIDEFVRSDASNLTMICNGSVSLSIATGSTAQRLTPQRRFMNGY